MSKRSFLFGTLVLLAGLATGTPSRAGSIVYTTVSFTSSSPALTDITITYSTGGGSLGSPTPGSGGSGASAFTATGTNVVDIHFTNTGPPAGFAGPFTFSFQQTDTSFAKVTGTSTTSPPARI